MPSHSLQNEESGSSSDADDDNADIEKTKILYSTYFHITTNQNASFCHYRPDSNKVLCTITNNLMEKNLPYKVFPCNGHQTFCVYRE